MQPDIIIVGHIIHETIQFPDRIITPVLGSPAAYASVIASVLGAQVGLVTKIGTDMPPELLKPFQEAGVDTRGVRVEGETSTRNLLIYDAAGNKEVRYLHKAPNILFSDLPEAYRSARLIFICPMDYEVPLATVRDLRSLGAPIVVDLGGYGGATSARHPSPEERPPVALKELVGLADVVKGSLEDCRHLFGTNADEEEIVQAFIQWGARVGMVTLGERGALVATANGARRVPALASTVVDVTGAGDAFSAGFLVAYLRSGDPLGAARFGCATASLVIEGTGGVRVGRMPTSAQVLARLHHQGKASPEACCPPPSLPRPIMVSDEGSFAYYTVTERLPAIARRVIAENDFPPTIADDLEALARELPGGTVRPLHDDGGPDLADWAAYVRPYLGQRWLDIPWYFAETYFYRRLLEATRYFSSGPWQGIDPFATQKRMGLASALDFIRALSARINVLVGASPDQRWQRAGFIALVSYALWGNRMDLSLWPAEATPRGASPVEPLHETTNILVDDTQALADRVESLRGAALHFIVDNAGLELFCDLGLADYLLACSIAGTVVLHLKAHPTFVSDALIRDVHYTVETLAADADAATQALAARLRGYIASGRLQLREHLFWTAPLPFWAMPDAVRRDLTQAALVFIKGDMNYRRLLGDLHWPFTTRLADVACYFPSPFVALRTLKSELAVDLRPDQVERLTRADPQWLTDGRWGVIQLIA